MGLISRLRKTIRGEWRYKGVTNYLMNKHSWTDGNETVDIYWDWMNGTAHNPDYAVEVNGRDNDATLQLSNGFVPSMMDAAILADMYMDEDSGNPMAFMATNRVNSDKGISGQVRQDEWLRAHRHDYQFSVIEVEKHDWL